LEGLHHAPVTAAVLGELDGGFKEQNGSDLHHARKRSPKQNDLRIYMRGIRAKVRARFGASGAA
jgi:hypothetical protein